MKRPLPGIIIYWSDHFRDIQRRHLTRAAQGIYWELLALVCECNGFVSDQELDAFRRQLRSRDRVLIETVLRSGAFQTGKGGLRHVRVDQQLSRMRDISRRNSANAKARWSRSRTHSQNGRIDSGLEAADLQDEESMRPHVILPKPIQSNLNQPSAPADAVAKSARPPLSASLAPAAQGSFQRKGKPKAKVTIPFIEGWLYDEKLTREMAVLTETPERRGENWAQWRHRICEKLKEMKARNEAAE